MFYSHFSTMKLIITRTRQRVKTNQSRRKGSRSSPATHSPIAAAWIISRTLLQTATRRTCDPLSTLAKMAVIRTSTSAMKRTHCVCWKRRAESRERTLDISIRTTSSTHRHSKVTHEQRPLSLWSIIISFRFYFSRDI